MKRPFKAMIALSAAAFGLCGALCVSAASADKAPERNLTLKEMSSSMNRDSKAEYMEHAALVMFKGEQQLTKETASSELKAQSDTGDLQIEEFWCLKDTGASKPGLQTQSSASYRSVALVTSRTLSTEQLIRQLKARDDVLYAEPNYQAYACSVNDPYFSSQWSMQNSDHTPNVQSVWDSGTTGSNRIVAVVDTGVDYTHPDLVNQMWKNEHYPTLKGSCGYDFIAGDADPMDENGHGTHCAGVIGAQGNNAEGICGVNQNIRIMALRTLDAEGSAWMSHEIAAYDYISKALDLGEPVQAINNSWGGGDSGKILLELVNIVGRKGAVSVFAAGNDGQNNDEVWVYPANLDSPYIISVAATRKDGELVNFSNYGEKTVDVAAPGTDILSSVSQYTYNPSIYGKEQDKYTAQFNDYESGEGWGALSELKERMHLNGEPCTATEQGKRKISLTRCEDGFLMATDGGTGHSILLEAKDLKAGDLICIPIPYEIGPDAQRAPYFSAMLKADLSRESGSGLVAVADLPQDSPLDRDALAEVPTIDGTGILYNDFDNWSHLSGQVMGEDGLRAERTKSGIGESDPLKRELVLTLYAETGGDYRLCFDDLALSRQDLSGPEVFGKYDFMSGTSMATPFISGAVALHAAQVSPDFVSEDAELLTSEVISLSKEGKLPIVQGGSFDFTKKPKELSPRIGSIDVDSAAGSIIITGTGLNPSTGLKVELGPDENSLREASILSQSDTKVVVKNEGWMNNVVSLRVTGYNGKAVSYDGWYLVDGKGTYITAKDAKVAFSGEPMATDGRYIYFANSTELSILTLDTEKLSKGAQTIAVVDPDKVFQWQKDQMSPYYVMQFGSDLVYCNGKLYSVVEYGEADQPEYVDDEYSGELLADELGIYSSRFALISVDVNTGKVKNLGALPEELARTEDYTMAAYNGTLLFLGGYSHELNNLTTAVRVYTPGKGWSEGTALPQPRAGGKALQVGSRLVYTLGAPLDEASSAAPANLVFDGKRWSVSSVPTDQGIQSLTGTGSVVRDHREYPTVQASVGAAKDGLVYMGLPAANYGDTFVYNVFKDCFTDTGYNYLLTLDDPALAGIAVGETLYGFDGMNVLTAPLTAGSGFQSVSVSKNKGGKVSGILTVPSGNDAVLTVKADKGYAIASIQVNGKKVKVSNSSKQTLTLKAVQKKQSLKVQFKKAVRITVKAGKGGTVTGSTLVPSGGNVSLTVKADKGYRIQSIQVNGKKVKVKNSGKQKITLKRVKKNQVLKVVFRKR